MNFYKKSWFMWVMLFVFTPVGLYLLWKNENYGKKTKIALSVVFSFLFLVGISGDSKKSGERKPAEPPARQEVAATPEKINKAEPPSQKSTRDFGDAESFWKNYGAELSAVNVQIAYNSGDRGALGSVAENAPRVRVTLGTGFLSSRIKEVELKLNNGDISRSGMMGMFADGAFALVSMTNPDLSTEECKQVLADVRLTANAKGAPKINKTVRGDVEYTLENGIQDFLGLSFTAKIK